MVHKYSPVTLQVGQRFGRWKVLADTRPVPVLCDCGEIRTVWCSDLLRGKSRSCGCLKNEKSSQRLTKHGYGRMHEHSVWRHAKARCLDPNNRDWKNYGGRGITMCNEWINSFEAFLQHIGMRPLKDQNQARGLFLDRIDNNRGYEPGNVRWATMTESNRNRRNVKGVQ